MHNLKSSLRTVVLATTVVVGAMVASVTLASAGVAWTSYGEYWTTKERYAVTISPPELGIQFYDNRWRESHRNDAKYHWMKDRDDDHGYYSRGEWHAVRHTGLRPFCSSQPAIGKSMGSIVAPPTAGLFCGLGLRWV